MSKEYLEAFERMTEHLDLEDEYSYKQLFEDEKIIKQALINKSKKEQAFDYLIRHFNIECDVEAMKNGEVWARFVHIQSKEDKGTCDTTATANLVDYGNEFNLIKEVLECLKN